MGGGGNAANITLGTELNDPLTYDLVLEHHQPIISTLVEPGGRLERKRYIVNSGRGRGNKRGWDG